MFIQTEETPNPATLKFLPGRSVLGTATMDFRAAEDASASPLARRLFGVEGVTAVMLGPDFVTVTKADGEWAHLKPAILGAIMDHFVSGAPVLEEGAEAADAHDAFADYTGEDKELIGQIIEILDTRVRPAVARDGGDITFHGFKDGIVYLNMVGSCAGCPSSAVTLKDGIENLLRHFVPEVEAVEQV